MTNQYHIAVTALNDQAQTAEALMDFECAFHDNLAELLPKVTERLALSADKAPAFLLGLKLLGEVLMSERSNPNLKAMAPHFKEIMLIIKPKRHRPDVDGVVG